jgi:ABC-type sugar transport system permease subunit
MTSGIVVTLLGKKCFANANGTINKLVSTLGLAPSIGWVTRPRDGVRDYSGVWAGAGIGFADLSGGLKSVARRAL